MKVNLKVDNENNWDIDIKLEKDEDEIGIDVLSSLIILLSIHPELQLKALMKISELFGEHKIHQIEKIISLILPQFNKDKGFATLCVGETSAIDNILIKNSII